MLTERLQILVDADRRERLEREAEARGTSVAAIVREAIDLAFPSTSATRASAGRRLLDAPPMDVPEPVELAAELDALRAHRR